eukprot:TRINITY_DN2103_c0_g1_i1.p1 TRINITY_DN2103_c0_g1~~TRINITY_DN2103_c0_g1_i1.p1  ORF type:complete len:588 (+),score=155.06 TRINITY_DN2103_c0_g1_i1:140-1903(+)
MNIPNLTVRRIDSTLNKQQLEQVINELKDRKVKILYVSPERLSNPKFWKFLKETNEISLFAIDEAHCISEWGFSFRPEYDRLAQLKNNLNAGTALIVTATSKPSLLSQTCEAFNIKKEHVVRTSFYRKNLTLLTQLVPSSKKLDILIDKLSSRPPGLTLIYVTSRAMAADLSSVLVKNKFDANPYHAGMTTLLRNKTQDWFKNSTNGICVATVAFGMGVHIPNIRYIYHYNVPKNLELYAQQVGRAGRDGLDSVCDALVSSEDERALYYFTKKLWPTSSKQIKDFLQSIYKLSLNGRKPITVSPYQWERRYHILQALLLSYKTKLEELDIIQDYNTMYRWYYFDLNRDIDKDFIPSYDQFSGDSDNSNNDKNNNTNTNTNNNDNVDSLVNQHIDNNDDFDNIVDISPKDIMQLDPQEVWQRFQSVFQDMKDQALLKQKKMNGNSNNKNNSSSRGTYFIDMAQYHSNEFSVDDAAQALEDAKLLGFINLNGTGNIERFTFTKKLSLQLIDELSESLFEITTQNQSQQQYQITEVLNALSGNATTMKATTPTTTGSGSICIHKLLCQHFGEVLENDCGHCTPCLNKLQK